VAFRGKVDSFQAGTGSRFSVFPLKMRPEISSKSFKEFPSKSFSKSAEKINLLVPGMSVVPKVKVR
jgi:membrane fusion protein (multidrug efflux system)